MAALRGPSCYHQGLGKQFFFFFFFFCKNESGSPIIAVLYCNYHLNRNYTVILYVIIQLPQVQWRSQKRVGVTNYSCAILQLSLKSELHCNSIRNNSVATSAVEISVFGSRRKRAVISK